MEYSNGMLLEWNITQQKKKKKERETISPFTATWMNLESIMLCEMSDRERQIPYDLTYT